MIQTGKFGMQLLDDHLWNLSTPAGIISAEEMIDKTGPRQSPRPRSTLSSARPSASPECRLWRMRARGRQEE